MSVPLDTVRSLATPLIEMPTFIIQHLSFIFVLILFVMFTAFIFVMNVYTI
jgi:hypothetical protein